MRVESRYSTHDDASRRKAHPRQDGANVERYVTPTGEERFRVRIRVHGQRFSRSFATLEAAQDWRDETKQARRNKAKGEIKRPGSLRQPPQTLVAFVRDVWWPGPARSELAQRTRENYYRVFKNWVAPSPLGAMSFGAIDPEDILDWQEWCRQHGAGEPTIRTAQKVISKAYRWAAARPKRTGVTANPVAAAGWPKEARSHEVHVFSPVVIERIRRRILAGPGSNWGRSRDALLLSLMSQTGIRPGEARAVRLRNVGERVIRLPKTKNSVPRTVPLWAPLSDDIRAFAVKWNLKPEDHLVGQRSGAPMSFAGWENWRDDSYIPARDAEAKAAGDEEALAGARAYDLCRHSYAAQQIAALIPLAELARIMGHSTQVLSSTYMAELEERRGRREPLDPETAVAEARRQVEGERRGTSRG